VPNDSSGQGPERLAAQAGSPHEEVQRARLDAGDFGAFMASLLESGQLYADTEAGRKGMGSPVMARLVYAEIESQLDMLLARVSLPDSGDAPRAPTLCPICGGQGWYAVPNRGTGEPEQEQCERCYGTASAPDGLRALLVQATEWLDAMASGNPLRDGPSAAQAKEFVARARAALGSAPPEPSDEERVLADAVRAAAADTAFVREQYDGVRRVLLRLTQFRTTPPAPSVEPRVVNRSDEEFYRSQLSGIVAQAQGALSQFPELITGSPPPEPWSTQELYHVAAEVRQCLTIFADANPTMWELNPELRFAVARLLAAKIALENPRTGQAP